MSPDFASAAQDVAAAPPPQATATIDDTMNMFNDAAQAVADDSRASLRTRMIDATKVAPDKYAKDKQAGAAVGVPPTLVDDHVRDMATAQQADQLQQDSPRTANQFQLPDFAHLAHDDVPQLTGLEKVTDAGRKSTVDSLMDAPYAAVQGFAGQGNKALETFGLAASTIPMLWDKVTGGTAAQDWWFKHAVDPYVNNEKAFALDQNAGFSEKALNAVGSAIGMLAQAMATGGPAAAVPAQATVREGVKQMVEHGASSMMIPATEEAMTTARHVFEATGGDTDAAVRAAQMSYFTTLMGGVVPLSKPGGILGRSTSGFVSGVATGEGSRVLMNAALPPNMQQPFDPENAVISGLMGSVLALGGPREDRNIVDLVRKTYIDASRADNAQKTADVLKNISDLSTMSKLRERDPEVFHQFMETLTEDNKLQNIYVRADQLIDTLDKAGISRAEFKQLLPEIEAQINEAVHTQGDIRIPMADYATTIAGSKMEPFFLENSKVDPHGMTFAEAKVYQQQQAETMKQQAQTVVEQRAADQAIRDSADKVERELRARLEATNRFTGAVTGAYAKMATAFFVAQAKRFGITPEEAYIRYPLNIRSEPLEGATGRTLDQFGPMGTLGRIRDAVIYALKSEPPPGSIFTRETEGFGDVIKRGIDEYKRISEPQAFRRPPNFRTEEPSGRTYEQSGLLGSRVKEPTPVVRKLLDNLTPSERRKVTDKIADRIVDLMAKLPTAAEMAHVALAGSAKRGWYKESSRALMSVFGYDAPRFAMLLAAMSPQTSVQGNLRNALHTWANWEKAGRPTDEASIIKIMGESVEGARGEKSVLDAWKNNAVRALGNEDVFDLVLSGPKVHSFWMNLVGNTQEVTLDTWMANFALVNQTMFKGTLSGPPVTDPGKGPGYMAYAARVREAAAKLSKMTGEEWTPSEVQETIWSWSKALYEKSAAANETRTPEQIIKEGALSDSLINATPDFSSLLLNDEYAAILKGAGYHEELNKLAADRAEAQRQPGEDTGDESKASAVAPSARKRYELAAARRLTALREFGQSNLSGTSTERAAGVDEAETSARAAAGTQQPLLGLPQAPLKIGEHYYVAGPFEMAHDVAAQYMRDAGLPYAPIQTYLKVQVERAQRIATEFEKMKHDPTNPEVKAAYDAMINETMAQWDAIKKTGLKVEFIQPGQQDPYRTSPRMAIEDVTKNNHLWVYPTSTGYGPNLINIGLKIGTEGMMDHQTALDILKHAGVIMHAVHESNTEPTLVAQLQRPLTPDEAHMISLALKQESIAQLTGGHGELHGPAAEQWRPFNPDYFLTLNGKTATQEGLTLSDNPLLRPVGESINGHPMVANDVFRIVHDYFGHIKDGVGFRADGEENAWRSHSSMYSPLARRAMTNETRGQNSWVNFGPHGDTNRHATAENTQYAPQKIGLMPEWVSEEGRADPVHTLDQNARGSISFPEKLSEGSTITLLKNADLSTFMHESGHFYLEALFDMSSHPDAPQEIRDDVQKILNWFGVKDHATWNSMDVEAQRPLHEKFARGFEAYLFEGKAPSHELATLFAKFRSWLISVYHSISKLGVTLTPEVRGVMDRLLASDDQIAQAEASRGMFALFSEKPEGMTDKQWVDYLALNKEATQTAVDEVQRKSLRDMQWLSNAKSQMMRKLQAKADTEREAARQEVTNEVAAMPVYRAEAELREGKITDPQTGHLIEGMKGVKLDSETLQKLYPGDMPGRPDLTKLAGLTGKDGLDPEIAAEIYGFPTGDALVHALADRQPRADMVQGMVDQRMLERHGEMADPISIERAAEAAIHNSVRARMIATELKAVSKALLPAKGFVKGATDAADAAIAQRKVKDLDPRQHEAAELRAAKETERALKAADTAAAVTAKRAQLLNNRLAKAAMKAQDDVKAGLDYMAKFSKPKVRENIEVSFRDQIDGLLDRFDLRRSMDSKDAALARKASLEGFVEKLSAMKFNLDIPQSLLNEANRMHYSDMSVEAFRGLVDSIKAIDHLGRAMQKVQDGAESRLLAEAALDASVQTAGLPQRKSETNRGLSMMAAKWMGAKSLGRSWQASLLKIEQMVDWLDNRDPNGIFNRLVFRKIATAETARNDLDLKVTKQWEAAIKAMPKDAFKDNRKVLEIPGVIDGLTGKPQRVTWPEKMMLAMIRGDASHFMKLLKGEKWAVEPVLKFLDENVSKAEWDFLHAISKTFSELEPLKHAMLRDLGGSTPESVARIPFNTQHGEYPGWYVPITYDPARSREVELRHARHEAGLFEDNIFNRADTSTGRENTRNENYAKPMLLSIEALPRVLKDEIRDITTRKAIIEADRFLSHPLVRDSISSVLSKEHYNQFNGWLLSIANDAAVRPNELQMWDKFAHGLRTRTTMVGLGFRLSTMFMHGMTAAGESIAEAGPKAMIKGTFNSKTLAAMTTLGPKWLEKGLANFIRSDQFEANRDFIFERSGEMRHRANEFERDVREQLREINLKLSDPATGALKRAKLAIQARAYSGIGMLDMASALPTWMGGYLKALTPEAQGGLGMNEQDAVYFADKTVRNAHGGGGIKDMAAVQRGGEWMKLFTMFYTFWNHNVNRIIDTAKLAGTLPATARSGDMSKLGDDVGTVVLRTFMYTLGVQAVHALIHPPKDDEPDHWLVWFAKQMGLAAFSGIPVFRDIANHYFGGKDYEASPITSVVHASDAVLKDVEGKARTHAYIKHALTAAGYVFGMPLGQPGSTAQFLSDVWDGSQNPQDMAEWWHGLSTGKAR